MKPRPHFLTVTALLSLFPLVVHSQSTMEFQSGTNIEVTTGADICADNVIINGTYSGTGTKCGELLPVTLVSFTGSASKGGVVLEWKTVSEVNNYGFYVQRSQDTLNRFEVLQNSFVPGHGTTTEAQQYSYTDSTPTQGRWWYRLQQIDLDGTVHYTEAVHVDIVTSVKKEEALPTEFSLSQNYPNPFNPLTTINFALPHDVKANLAVYNTLGQKVAQLVDEVLAAGYRSVVFDASELASGVYIYQLRAGDFVSTKRMLVLK